MTTALVTGASRGIGLEVSRQLVREGVKVLLGVRNPARAPKIAGARHEQLDVADPRSIAACAARLQAAGEQLDLLVNNAGVYTARVAEIWATNLRGPIQLWRACAPVLAARARIVNVSSGLGALSSQPHALVERLQAPSLTIDGLLALAEERPGGYGASKAAINAFTRLLVEGGALATSIDPGWVKTDMGGAGAPRELEQGAGSVLWGCRLPPDGPNGGFYLDGKLLPW
jgi:NAD(P)-dependent dehydrogenase (short-subunit alcohol dehydrogenase family)